MQKTLEEPQTEEEKIEDKNPGLSHLQEDDKNMILDLRKEAAEKRIKAKELEKELNKIKAEQQERENNKLKEDGKLQELLDAKEKELNELKSLKDENEQHKEFFTKQLETALGKLSQTNQDLINDSGMALPKKLEWALRLGEEKLSKTDSPDSRRPGGDASLPEIDLEEYKGPEGRTKLLKLRDVNKPLYEKILELKNIT